MNIHNIHIEHNLLDINYDKLTHSELIKLKLNVLSVLRQIDNINLINFNQFNITSHGYLHNPYINVVPYIDKFKHQLNTICERLTEDFILNNIDISNKLTYSTVVFLPGTYNNDEFDTWIENIKNFNAAVELYNKCVENRDELLSGYLGFDRNIDANKYYRVEDSYRGKVYTVIERVEETLKYESYYLSEDSWYLTTSGGILSEDAHIDIWKSEFPENFI
jgi:hypothetical protein